MKEILNRRKFFGSTSDGCWKNERLKESGFLKRLINRITLYILSLSLLAGSYISCSKDRVSSNDDLESRTQIVFTSTRDGNYEIYVMDADGTNQTRLTNNPAFDRCPLWAPNGQKIFFLSNRDGNFEIYVMNRDGTNQINLTNNSAYDGFPPWDTSINKPLNK